MIVNLDVETSNLIENMINSTGKSVLELINTAIKNYLEDLKDAEIADAAYDNYLAGNETTIPIDQVERNLGMAD